MASRASGRTARAAPRRRRRAGRPVERALVALSAALCAFSAWCYSLRPDAQAAFTVWPSWTWTIIGLLLLAIAGTRGPRRAALVVGLGWLGYTAAFTDEAKSLLRGYLGSHGEIAGRPRRGTVRVVTVNCCGGSIDVVREALACHPDVLLLQESPSPAQLRRIAAEARGDGPMGAAPGPDGSILARGSVTPAGPPSDHYTRARVRLPDGPVFDVVSVRLSTPALRTDLWRRDCWRSYARSRARQRTELSDLAGAVGTADRPVIVGGDFNAPQGDAVFSAMPRGLRDAFAVAGVGWGNTILDEFPALRIDQVWVGGVEPERLEARRTAHSDHRMVICDLRLRP